MSLCHSIDTEHNSALLCDGTFERWTCLQRHSTVSFRLLSVACVVAIMASSDVTAAKTTTTAAAREHPLQHYVRSRTLKASSSSGISCALTHETYRFVLDPVTNEYAALVLDNSANEASAATSSSTSSSTSPIYDEDYYKRLDGIARWKDSDLISTMNTTTNSTSNNSNSSSLILARQHQYTVLDVRACTCLSRLSSREDFCEAHFNTCVIHNKYEPVQCYTKHPSDAMVKVVWVMSLVSIVVLFYLWQCTEHGTSAKHYIRRTCHYRNVWSTPQERLRYARDGERYLEHLLQYEPERAAYMYRHYLLRERDRMRRQQALSDTWWYQWSIVSFPASMSTSQSQSQSPQAAATDDNGATAVMEETTQGAAHHSASGVLDATTHHHTNGGATANGAFLDATRPQLKLKVKIYRSAKEESYVGYGGGTNTSAGNGAASPTSPHKATTSASPTAAIGIVVPSWVSGNGATGSGTTNMLDGGCEEIDRATFDVMDDETERGIRCAICLCRLRDGDIIGDIPCRHCMHKECLKDWLPRKNRCPLCQTTGIARVVENVLATTTAATTISSSSSHGNDDVGDIATVTVESTLATNTAATTTPVQPVEPPSTTASSNDIDMELSPPTTAALPDCPLHTRN